MTRSVVGDRLRELYTRWRSEQAVQFDGRWWTWGDFAETHDALAAVVRDHGVPDADAVVIVMRQTPGAVAAELATLAMGRTALLVSPMLADRDLAAEIVTLHPTVLVAGSADWSRSDFAAAAEASGALGLEVGDHSAVVVRCAGDVEHLGPRLDAAVTVFSSGTTGRPKRLPVAWETFVQLGGGPHGRDAVSGRGAMILSLPLVTLGGLLSISRLVFGGRPMAMLERFEIHAWAALVKEHRPKVMGAPPPVVKMILDADITPDHFEGVTAYMTSSAPVAPEIARAFEQRYGIPVLLGYGATEFLNSVTGWTPALWQEFGATKLGSVGRATAGVQLRVVDGILEVDPPQRAGNLPAGWLCTNDRARIDDDGFVWILGRADDVIIRGGFKVDLANVEAALLEHPLVVTACAVGLADERVGTVPAAVVTIAGAVEEAELIAWTRDRLAAYAVPTVVRIVDAIPQTSTLKNHRAAIVAMLT